MNRLDGKVALITGSGGALFDSEFGLGFGGSSAFRFCQEGATVIVSDINDDTGQQFTEELREKGFNAHYKHLDTTNETEWKKTIDWIEKDFGKLDILVNNAGGPPPGDFRDWGREDWMNACIANMFTPIELIKAYVDGMQDRKFGRIINITSSSVKAPIDILGLSNGARSGLTGFVAGIARKTIINNVTINSILPGPFDTDRLRNSFKFVSDKTGQSVEEVRAARAAENPSGRFGTPDEFGAACAYLCSSHAGYITGQNLLIDGGGYPGTY